MSSHNPHSELIEGLRVDITGPESDVALVLVHGSLDRKAGMALLAREAQKVCTVIRYDRRGYGASFPHDGPFTVKSNIDDLEAIINNRNVVIFGHSFGGHMALGAAERLPRQVRAIATYESPLSWMSWWSNNSAGASAIQEEPHKAAESFMIRLIGQRRWDELPEKTKEARRREGSALIGELSDLRRDCPWDISQIVCPALIGVGERAMAHHQQGAQWLVDNVAKARLVTIAGAGHGAHVSHAGAVFQHLIAPLLRDAGINFLGEEP